MTSRRIFACCDSVHDADLYAVSAKQRVAPRSTLSADDSPRDEIPHAGREAKLRGCTNEVDAVAVICGEYAVAASNATREFGIAQEQDAPSVLLRGRRSASCTRPVSARADDPFYAWSRDVITSQIDSAVRMRSAAVIEACEPRRLGRR